VRHARAAYGHRHIRSAPRLGRRGHHGDADAGPGSCGSRHPQTVEHLTNEGRFSDEEIEAAVAEICQEFGIDPKRGVNLPPSSRAMAQKVKRLSQAIKQALLEGQRLACSKPLSIRSSGPVQRDFSQRNDGLWLALVQAGEGDEP